MKINKTGLHPLYDQYSNEENRLTHALLHTIGSSEWIFSRFLKDFLGLRVLSAREIYEISTQKIPFSHGDNALEQVESIPDAWIADGSSKLGIVIEVKNKKNALRLGQLQRHANRITGYKHQNLLVITPDLQRPNKIIEMERKAGKNLNVIWRSWNDVYSWLTELPITKSTKREKETFMTISMREYLERRSEVLGFQGIKFQGGFNVLDAKPILNAEMEELEPTVRKLYRDSGKRRPAITTFSQEAVWDCFGNEKGFTTDLHFTLGINEKSHDISITIPNSAKQVWSRLKKVFSDEGNQEQLFSILKSLRNEVPHLFIEFNQRHFVARKFSVRDGYMEFDIDTLGAPFRKKDTKAKEFPVWLPAIKAAIVNKRRINGQVMFKSRFFFNETKGIDKPQFIETVKGTIKAFKPLYGFLRERNLGSALDM